MRRQGRPQHGIVRTYRILPPPLNPRMVNSSTSPPTDELSPSKPTKGNRKVWSGQVHWLRSNDIASSSYKLLTCRILTGPGPVLNLSDVNCNGDDSEDKKGREEAEVENMKREKEEDGGGSHDDDDESMMSFYDVGMMMMMEHVFRDDDEEEEEEEEDGWCLV